VDTIAAQIEAARHRVAESPTDAEALFALGNALWHGGAQDEAVAAFARAIAVRPDNAEARNNLGNALLELGRPEEAVRHYRAALAIRPKHAPTLYNLGNALLACGEAEAAEARFRAALALQPTHAGAWNNLGNLLRARGNIAEAAECYRQAVTLRPDAAGSHNNLGSALLALHRAREAAACFAEAVRLQPDYADAYNNLGGAQLALDQPEDAARAFRRAVDLDPSQAQARFGEALAFLSLGRFAEGWEAYESRWLDPRFNEGVRAYATPRWNGESVAGRTVLLHCEQGLGDSIQFVRYVPLVRARGARVVLEAPAPLLGLFAGLADEVVSDKADLPPHDFHCPLLSLPRLFGTDMHSIPADVPYLHPDPALAAAWARTLGPATKPRIGIAFSGSEEHPEDALRSIPLARLRPLLDLQDAEFHVVQKDIRADDARTLREMPGVRAHHDRLETFADTAALLTQIDLMISVDTSVAHLGAALARPVWILVQFNADFRWLRVRTDSPWYPTVRLFRQSQPLAWETEIDRIVEAVRSFSRDRRGDHCI
jgi:tetratricopeptide (TPR) repeat protein